MQGFAAPVLPDLGGRGGAWTPLPQELSMVPRVLLPPSWPTGARGGADSGEAPGPGRVLC